MKKIDIRNRALSSENGEYVLGLEDTGSHACYMIYGVLKPGEKGRLIKPGKGHEEILLAMKGDLVLTGDISGRLEEGSVLHIIGDTSAFLENAGSDESIYIISGGHSDHAHHH
ncbi:MAG: hypothetical protein MUE70_13070 [Desulfobacterales bacterium]|jgi:hypothetical protein|nr:hypothetical protein [Desulfobacterales bacterium]